MRSQAGSSAIPGKSPGAGQKSDESLVATLPIDMTEVSTPKPQWNQTQGPEGGNVQSLFVASNGDFYAEADTGLYRLADDKSRWNLVSADMPINGSWQIAERNDTLYIVSDTQVLASIDRGETWNSLGARPEGQLIDLVITDGVQADIIMYLGLAGGVFHSVDAGKSWNSVSDQLVNKKIRAITAIENVVFVGTDSGLYRLNSAGWTLLPVGESDNIRAVASAEHRLYVAVGEKAVNKGFGFTLPVRMTAATSLSLYRSTDLGDSWQILDFIKTKTEPSSQSGMTISVGPATPESDQNGKDGPKDSETGKTSVFEMVAVEESLFVLDDENSYYSSDAGENWVALDSDIPDRADVSRLVSLNAHTFYRNGQSGIYRTTDAGKTWHPFNAGFVKTSVMNLVSVQNVLYANVGVTLLTSSNAGESWIPVPSSLGNIINLARFNDVLYARGIEDVNRRLHLFRLSTGDNRLTPVPGMPILEEAGYAKLMEERFKEILPVIDQTEGQKNILDDNILEDLDADVFVEDNSKVIEETLAQIVLSLIENFAVSGDTYYMEYEQRLFRWKTGTTEWVDTGLINEGKPSIDMIGSANTPDSLPSNLAVSGSSVYVGKWDGHLFQSFDEGNTWNDVTANLPFSVVHFRAVTFAGSTVYVATDKGVAYSSDGTDWHTATDTEGTLIIMDEPRVPDVTMYLALRDEGVFRSTNRGTHWKPINEGLADKRISAIAAVESTLFAGTNRGLHRLDSESWRRVPVGTSNTVYSLAVLERSLYVGTGPDLFESTPDIGQIVRNNQRHSTKIFLSRDLGASWTEITPENGSRWAGLPSGITILTAGKTLLALGATQFRSTDGGETWTDLGVDTDAFMLNSIPSVGVNERMFYKVGAFGVHRTTDSGESWHLFMRGMAGTRIEDMVAFNSRLYAYNGSEVSQSINGGRTWKGVRVGDEQEPPELIAKEPSRAHPLFDSKFVITGNALYLISPIGSDLRIFRLSTDGNILNPVRNVPDLDGALSLGLPTDSEKAKQTHLSEITVLPIERRVKTKTLTANRDVFYLEYKRRLFKWRLGDPEWTNTGLVDTGEAVDEGFYTGFKIAVSGETVYVGKRDGQLLWSLDGGNSWRDITPNLPLDFAYFKEIVFFGFNPLRRYRQRRIGFRNRRILARNDR